MINRERCEALFFVLYLSGVILNMVNGNGEWKFVVKKECDPAKKERSFAPDSLSNTAHSKQIHKKDPNY